MQNKKNNIITQIKEKIILYGYLQTFILIIKSCVKKLFFISWDNYYLMEREITASDIYAFDKDLEIRKLSATDYDNDLWKAVFWNNQKQQLYIKRFMNPDSVAYGVFCDKNLACSGWILYGEVAIREQFHYMTDKSTGLLFDDYCHPEYRGRGLYKLLTNYRISEMAKNGVSKGYVVVLSYNRASIKAQLRCGFRVKKKFHIVTLGHITYCSLKKI